MKNNLIIVESNLTYVILLYLQKSYPFIKHFFPQNNDDWNVIK
jgi:hypothetical protein